MRGTSELAELGKQLSASPGNFSAADVTDEFIVRQLFAAELLAGCGDTEKAVALLKRLLEFRPDAIDVRTKLKDIYLRSDMIKEASREFMEIARVYESHGDTTRAKDFSVRAERLAQQLAEPPRGTNTSPAIARPVERPAKANAKQTTMAPVERVVARAEPVADAATTRPTSSAATAQPTSTIAQTTSAAAMTQTTAAAGITTGPLALGRPDPVAATEPADDAPRSQRGGVVFYAVAAAIVITLLSGWFFARRWYAEELNSAYQTLARANSLPLPPHTAGGEPFTMPRSEESMDVRAESPSSNAAGTASQPSQPAHDEAAPRDEHDREPTPAAPSNPNANVASPNTTSAPPKPTAPPVVAAAPNVATNPDGGSTKAPVGLPRNGDSAEPPPPPAETRKAPMIVKAESLQRVQPDYPTNARTARQAGMVTVEVSINERGDVVAAQVISGPSLLRQAATAAARRWKFKPATRDGKPISSASTIMFNFKL